ncbi:ComEC/Rec2 family competence protein [Patescibacteria group bacterium]|nr:ComEC/Rec2 family competence protein [Patescibacteria group bacterium]
METVSVSTLTAVLGQLLPEPHAGLLAGILFGTRASLPRDLTQELITSGTIHIIALSGMNISLVTAMVGTTLLRWFSRRIASLLSVIFIIGFVWFIGPSPSVIRAAIMGILSLLAVVFGRQRWTLFFWLVAGASMLLYRPAWLTDLSFELSVLATLGIILFGGGGNAAPGIHKDGATSCSDEPADNPHPSFFRLVRSVLIHAGETAGRTLRDDLQVTLAAQVFTIPLILIVFHRISLVSPLSNLLIGFLIAPLTIAGWAAAVLGFFVLPLGIPAAWICWVWLEYLLTVVRVSAGLPMASVGW